MVIVVVVEVLPLHMVLLKVTFTLLIVVEVVAVVLLAVVDLHMLLIRKMPENLKKIEKERKIRFCAKYSKRSHKKNSEKLGEPCLPLVRASLTKGLHNQKNETSCNSKSRPK